jgi:hypothetical protein
MKLVLMVLFAAAPVEEDLSDLEDFPLIVEEEVIETQEIVFDDSVEELDE